MRQSTPSSSTNSTTRSGNSNSRKGASLIKVIQGLLILVLGLVLGHTFTLLHQGHLLVEQQSDAFATRHKNEFLQGKEQQKQRQRQEEYLQHRQKRRQEKEQAKAAIKNDERSHAAVVAAAVRRREDEPIPAANVQEDEDMINKAPPTDGPILSRLRILVAIASYDFHQVPHLEETLDGYHELCAAGAKQVDVVVHTTVVYPVVWLDLWRTRFPCPRFQITFHIENKQYRLHLVDLHRHLFYEQLDKYDLFIYTEDDQRISPTTVATYWQETQTLKQLLEEKGSPDYKDYTHYNIGLVRYEYNFPSTIINDKTRHATENVTRVYWEHSWPIAQKKPVIPNAAIPLRQLNSLLNTRYLHMKNHHQGMYLATRAHLKTWRDLDGCQFDKPQKRPGYGPHNRQPLLGTQRVWMSSYQLYETNYCNIQQVLPVDSFGALTIHHVPNKNYRRKKGGKTLLDFGNKTSDFIQGAPQLITALKLHIAMRTEWPMEPASATKFHPVFGMIDHVTRDRNQILDERLQAWQDYVQRGGLLVERDMNQTNLIEWVERLEWMTRMAERKKRAEEIKLREQGLI